MSNIKVFYDLHIHTALSPCGQDSMRPNSILEQASSNGLDIIAICDHNSVKQLINFDYIKEKYNVLVVPGVEITVNEGYHVCCLFTNFINAYEFGNEIIANLNPYEHDLSKLGHQIVFDHNDDFLHEITSVTHQQFTKITIHKLREYMDKYGGIMILGHIERYDEKIYKEVQTIYKNCFDAIEINARTDYETIVKEYPFLLNKTITRSTDAHDLSVISMQKNSFNIDEKTVKGLLKYIKYTNVDK